MQSQNISTKNTDRIIFLKVISILRYHVIRVTVGCTRITRTLILELISVLITLTLTPLIVLGINFKSVIGALWGYTCTLEITLTLLNCFQINFPKNHTYTYTFISFWITNVAISCAPYRIQNPSDPQSTPQNTPRILSRNRNTKKLRKPH